MSASGEPPSPQRPMQLHHDHDHDHDDGHDHLHAAADDQRRLGLALLLTAGFMGVELVAGVLSGSLALLADAGHMFTDAAALALALFAGRVARRPPDPRRSYGYARVQVLAAFVNGLALLAIVAWIAMEAAQRLLQPPDIEARTMLAVAAAGLVVNALAFLVLRGGSHDNLNLRGAALHVLGDLLGSVAAIAAGLIVLFTGWLAADPLLSLLVAALILRTGWQLTRESAHILLEGAPESVDVAALEREICARVPGVSNVHHSHLWCITPQRRIMTLHAVVGAHSDGDAVVLEIAGLLRERARIEHVTVQIERQRCDVD